jgi:hypothetical protein
MEIKNNSGKGFILIEILIAGFILTSSIAATMYLFRVGSQHLERANISNVLSSKLPQSLNFLKSIDIEKKDGKEEMGDGVTLTWNAEVVSKMRPMLDISEGSIQSPHELILYKVNFQLNHKSTKRDYEIKVFKFKRLVSPSEILF